jgi:amino acid adenylation domain-containing protein
LIDAVPRLPRAGSYEVSPAQRRLWILSRLDGASTAHNIGMALRLDGALDTGALRRAFIALVARHESLRTFFIDVDGEPRQAVDDTIDVDLPMHDLSGAEDAEEKARRRVGRMAAEPFDLRRAPLLRGELLCFGPQRHTLHLVIHHIVCDGWSLSVMARELGALYAGRALPPLRVHLRDCAVWINAQLRGEAAREEREYWHSRLTPPAPPLDLPSDTPRPPIPRFRGDLVTTTLPAPKRDALFRLAAAHRATPFMLLTALVKVLLHRYTGEQDIAIGTPIAERAHPDLEAQIGCFLNTLVLRDTVTAETTFADLLRGVRGTALDAYQHQLYPFDALVEECGAGRDPSRAPLCDVLVILQNAGSLALPLDGIRVTAVEVENRTCKNDLTFDFADEGDGLLLGIRYSTDLFRRDRIERMAAHFCRLAAAAVADPGRSIGRLDLLPDAERAEIAACSEGMSAALPAGTTIVSLFEEQVDAAPSRIAVVFEEREMTYGALDARANAIARRLPAVAVAGIFLERSLHLLPALLGVLKAGGAYLPLDPEYPAPRIAQMLIDSTPAVVLTTRDLAERLPAATPRLFVDDDESVAARVARPIGEDDLAYILYTSGSTGTPKGVEIPHRALANLLLSMRERPGMTARDAILAVTTISFDIAALELFLPLVSGGRVVIARSESADGRWLAARLRRGDITTMQATPSTWRMLLAAGWEGDAALKVLCGGEALRPDLAVELLARCRTLWNVYGPTETTIWSSACEIAAGGAVSVGRPIRNTRFYVLDALLQPAPIGVPGELFIAGTGVARGYRCRPDLTASRFLPDPFSAEAGARMYRTGDVARLAANGTFEVLGRADHQLKIRGHRVEPGEVEDALLGHPGVAEAVVVAHGESLAAYVVPHGIALDAAALREHVAERLPQYMVPGAVVALDAFPRTPAGKIDRAALPPPVPPSLTHAAPLDDLERAIAAVWSDALGVPILGRDDGFFDLGGHSLKATAALFRMERDLGLSARVTDIFRHPTVARFAALMRHRVRQRQHPLQEVEREPITADEWEMLESDV